MTRGDIALAALSGDYGKPRPVLIIQSDLFVAHPSVIVLPFTSDLTAPLGPRVLIQPAEGNGLHAASAVMVDKPHTLRREKLRQVVGRIAPGEMSAVDRALALFLGFA